MSASYGTIGPGNRCSANKYRRTTAATTITKLLRPLIRASSPNPQGTAQRLVISIQKSVVVSAPEFWKSEKPQTTRNSRPLVTWWKGIPFRNFSNQLPKFLMGDFCKQSWPLAGGRTLRKRHVVPRKIRVSGTRVTLSYALVTMFGPASLTAP